MKRSIYASEIADHDRWDAPTLDPFGSWRASIGLLDCAGSMCRRKLEKAIGHLEAETQ